MNEYGKWNWTVPEGFYKNVPTQTISLRNHLAGQAIGGLISKFGRYDDLIEDAYEMADDMIKESQK